jgi:glycosyltransferase involved in cell wall biosynthesis
MGVLDRPAFRDALADAEVFVSVPSSDATSVALLQAMAAGAFPIVSDLPSQRELITHGVNGFLAPLHDPASLAALIVRALGDATLRRTAAEINRRIVEDSGLNDTQMAKMEAQYYRLAGRPNHRGTEAQRREKRRE